MGATTAHRLQYGWYRAIFKKLNVLDPLKILPDSLENKLAG